MIDVAILNEQSKITIDPALETVISDLVALSLKEEGLDFEGEVSVMFCDDAYIHELNKTHRGKDQPTDVLSFPQYDDVHAIEEPYAVLGDIVISTDTAIRQSEEYNHPINRELGFLLVHSMFHLMGYDHDTEENTRIMRKKEEAVLTAYQLTR